MCGIAGIVGEADVALLRRMLEVLRHRGPDDLGTFVDGGVAIGQSPLSIIDVAGGPPPRLYGDGGPGMAGLLDGMFALAIWDGANLYLARDPIGIKPLYYAVRGGTFYFSSAAEALARGGA